MPSFLSYIQGEELNDDDNNGHEIKMVYVTHWHFGGYGRLVTWACQNSHSVLPMNCRHQQESALVMLHTVSEQQQGNQIMVAHTNPDVGLLRTHVIPTFIMEEFFPSCFLADYCQLFVLFC